MRSFFSLALILILMLQSLHQLGIIAYYNLNKTEISDLYCINKDKPDSCCKGQCYLSKQLNQSQSELPARPAFEERDIPFFVLPNILSTKVFQAYCSVPLSAITALILPGYENSTFHPPDYLV
ncbi:MAG: hypothetical protein IT245_05980 [Bacteroidia bacterium]|nr:hypothetical protein [Bacteroidia bacterium]